MLQLLRSIIRRAPLLCLILLIWILTAVLAFVGRSRGYSGYSTEHGRLPGISVVMRGLHDRVLPWSEAPARRDAEEDEAEEGSGIEEAAEGSSGSQKEGGQASAAEGEGEKQDQSGADTEEKENGKTSGSEKTDGGAGGTGDGSGTEKPDAAALKIPASSCSEVVPAKDYGVADSSYLSPEDTVYNTDTEGLFAPNGIYYSLQKVEESYFKDALFIGDSRTVGLCEYGGVQEKTSFLARESTTIYDLLDSGEELDYTALGKKKTECSLRKLLKDKQFRKIYISVGVNELGIPDTLDYYKEFRKVIKYINKVQPKAVIYIQGIMHVSKEKSKKDRVYNNTAIVQRNTAIATIANGRNIFYIDMNEALCDEDGNLRDELTGDGIHLKASACRLWVDFLTENAVVVPD